jgi:hypothetical protein
VTDHSSAGLAAHIVLQANGSIQLSDVPAPVALQLNEGEKYEM